MPVKLRTRGGAVYDIFPPPYAPEGVSPDDVTSGHVIGSLQREHWIETRDGAGVALAAAPPLIFVQVQGGGSPDGMLDGFVPLDAVEVIYDQDSPRTSEIPY